MTGASAALTGTAAGVAGGEESRTATGATGAIETEIIRSRLESIAEEMGVVLRRVSRSPLVSESRHHAAALLDGRGRLVAEVAGNLGHLVPIATSAAAALDKFAFDLQDDDVLIVNDPYAGGSSLGQLTLVTVTMTGDDLVLFPASRVQLTDIGGSQPGGLYPAAKELFQEGDIIPPVRLATAGRIEKDVLSRLLKNNRTPARYRADLEAMIAANRVGRRRIQELLADFGVAEVRAALDRILAYTERLVRSEVGRWPDGHWIAEAAFMDPRGARLTVHAAVTVAGEDLTIDLRGSSPQASTFVNSPLANTRTWALVGVLGYVPRPIPVNAGLLDAVTLVAPEGSVVNPAFPAPTAAAGYPAAAAVADAVAAALAQALPDRASLPVTTLPVLVLNEEPGVGDRYIAQPAMAIGGCGAAQGQDGWGWPAPQSGIDVSSPEVLELRYGLRILERGFVTDSGGAGRWRGGPGSRVVVTVDRPGLIATAIAFDAHAQAAGFEGGRPATPDRITLREGRPGELGVDPVAYRVALDPGVRLAITKGGGPGFGHPFDRSPGAVLDDVMDEYISIADAHEHYGVAVDPATMTIDEAATSALRRRGGRE